jgi:hypothetical protein
MPRKEYQNLSLKKERYELLRKEFENLRIEKNHGISFTEWVDNELFMSVAKSHFLKRFAPALALVGIHEDSLLVKDDRTQSISQITISNNKLFCSSDKGNDCSHIHYAMMLSALGRIVDIRPKRE